ncbi:hypothetical protein [Sphingobacterium corticibacter]|nr:hypothetical protein [Sphingobacterium corticibacter]
MEIVTAPIEFSLVTNPASVVQFINKLEEHYLARTKVFIDLKNVEKLDYSAVTILLSVMFSFKARKIRFNGNFPNNKLLAKRLIDSDFFKYLGRQISEKLEYKVGKSNQIFTMGNKEVNSELGELVMYEASKTIWGHPRSCKGLQRTILELMQNTNNHAAVKQKGEEHWWLSVNHDKVNKKVSFIFIDYGIGIFESLKYKPKTNQWFGWLDKLKTHLIHGGNDEIFKLLLNGQMHLTVTGQPYRGKGLPGIKEVFDRNQISELKIISNNVYADVVNGNYTTIKSEFNGTFVHWELNENNVSAAWIN